MNVSSPTHPSATRNPREPNIGFRDYGIPEEWLEWYRLTPEQRWIESGLLLDTFLTLGGSLEPEPDTESPFFDAKTWCPLPAHGRPGVRVLRGCGI